MERFVWLLLTGGLSMVAGLWLVTLFETARPPWLLGLGLVGLGVTVLGAGITSRIELRS